MKNTIFVNSCSTRLASLNHKVYRGKNFSQIRSVTVIACYKNADSDKKKAVEENRGRSGVYRLKNLYNGKCYIGSSTDIGRRLTSYYSFLYISAQKSSLICRALLKYGYAKFSIEILEYCKPGDAVKREQYYLDLLKPEYNILKTAGSSLGFKHSEEAIAKFRARRHTPETLEKFKTKVFSVETRAKISANKGTKVVVSDLLTGETDEYDSIRKAAQGLGAPNSTVRYYIKNQQIFRDRYQISTK
jgi:group I intron endonuclease